MHLGLVCVVVNEREEEGGGVGVLDSVRNELRILILG